MKRGRVKLNTI